MKKCILWGMGEYLRKFYYVVKLQEQLNKFYVVGVTSNTNVYSELYGYNFIKKEELHCIEFDFVIVMASHKTYRNIIDEAIKLGIDSSHIFSYRVLFNENFNVDRYINIKQNSPSIFANNCWGGLTYHGLDLEFMSPFINMFESDSDYIKILKNPKRYMEEELIEMRSEKILDVNYPIVKCGDVVLHFNHYKSFDEAKLCWNKRKKRINWDNLFIMMYTEDIDVAKEFAQLPYNKKVCFVPFHMEEKSLICVEFRNKGIMSELPFWKIVNGMAIGTYPYYDVFDLLEYAKFTSIVKLS